MTKKVFAYEQIKNEQQQKNVEKDLYFYTDINAISQCLCCYRRHLTTLNSLPNEGDPMPSILSIDNSLAGYLFLRFHVILLNLFI